MKYQEGKISTGAIAALAVLGCAVLIGVLMLVMFIGTFNTAVELEKGLEASYEDSQNVLSQYSLKIAESAQIPEMYTNDLKAVYTATVQGRYGEAGSQAMMQWIQEHNPNFDASLYKTIQQQIEAGRNKFEVSQRLVIEKKKIYETQLSYAVTGTLLRIMGFPKIDLDKIKIVKSEHSNNAFSSGVDKGLKLR